MKIEVILHPKFKKPEVWDDIVTHFRNEQSQSEIKGREICLVGDRVLSDILMGNRFGMFTILV